MEAIYILLSVIAILLFANIFLTVRAGRKAPSNELAEIKNYISALHSNLQQAERNLKDEFKINRGENAVTAKNLREEVGSNLSVFTKTFSEHLSALTKSGEEKSEALRKTIEEKLSAFQQRIEDVNKDNRKELKENLESFKNDLNAGLKDFKDHLRNNFSDFQNQYKLQSEAQTKTFSEHLSALTKSNEEKSEALRKSIEENFAAFQQRIENVNKDNRKELKENLEAFKNDLNTGLKDFKDHLRNNFSDFQNQYKTQSEAQNLKIGELKTALENSVNKMQEGNEKKLEEMRKTVDEKLNETLEKRLGESFKLVSERLEAVHKGLGDMQSLAKDVGSLNKTMNNVKSRGVLGEYQLHNLLEDLLTNEQYEQNVKTKAGSGATVEFAVRMPNGNNLEKTLWLPIDSKFPKEDYEALVDAYDKGETEKIEEYRKAFARSMRKNAQDIKEKYIDPPNTTEYGVMFLPYESLYAEVLRTPGLFEQLQKDYKITIAGPTTLSAFLNSLQMGFRTLAIEKRSSEVWDLLGAVKTEFGKFGEVLAKTKKKLEEATNVIDSAGVRSRAIERKLKTVQELPQEKSALMLESNREAEANEEEQDKSLV